MNAIYAIDRILKLDLDNSICGTIVTDEAPLDVCQMAFGSFRTIIEPLPNKSYLYEWRDLESPNEIEEPDALLIQTSDDGTMIIYLYELDEK